MKCCHRAGEVGLFAKPCQRLAIVVEYREAPRFLRSDPIDFADPRLWMFAPIGKTDMLIKGTIADRKCFDGMSGENRHDDLTVFCYRVVP